MAKRIWRLAASVYTTSWLLGLVTLFFVIGSAYFRFERSVLPQLNFQLFQDWMRIYGFRHLDLCWWFFALLFLLLLLGMNTAACMIDRLRQLLPQYKKSGRLEFAVTIMPTIIHMVFFVILSGHLLSSVTGSVEVVTCQSGQAIELPGQRRIEVIDVVYDTHSRPASLEGKLKGAKATLTYQSPRYAGRFEVAILKPVFRGGTSFHLDSLDKYAQEKKLRLILHRDIGIRMIIPGFLVIIGLLAWYFPALWRLKRKNSQ